MTWTRTFALLAILGGVLIGLAGLSNRPVLRSESARPDAPRLARRGNDTPSLTAASALIQRLRNGEVLYERNADVSLPIASLTKLMTALLFTEEADSIESILFSAGATLAGRPDDKRSLVPAGERLKAEDVLALMLSASDSDAAFAAAEHVARRQQPELETAPFGERIAAFVGLMGRRAGALDLAGTHYGNPSGSEESENISTARDLMRLAGYITSVRPELWAASRLREGFAFGAGGRRYSFVNTNPLLGEFPAMYGSKTGFNNSARGALLLVYRLAPEEPIAIVLLRSGDRFGDGRAAIRWLELNFVLESP